MNNNRSGFTILEMVVVVMMIGLFALVGINTTAGLQSRFAVRQAKNVFGSLHARTRAQAVEFGENVIFNFSTTGDSVWITRDGAVLEVVRFAADSTSETQAIDILGDSATYRLCMGPRGFADTSCGNIGSRIWVKFTQGAHRDSLRLMSMGQIIY